MQRNKAAIVKSGIDPDLKQLRRLQAIASNQKKKYVAALESVEHYWERVHTANSEQDSQLTA